MTASLARHGADMEAPENYFGPKRSIPVRKSICLVDLSRETGDRDDVKFFGYTGYLGDVRYLQIPCVDRWRREAGKRQQPKARERCNYPIAFHEAWKSQPKSGE